MCISPRSIYYFIESQYIYNYFFRFFLAVLPTVLPKGFFLLVEFYSIFFILYLFFCRSGSKIPFEELSINRLEGLKNDKSSQVLKTIMKGLDFQSFSAPEELFNAIKERKEGGKVDS